MSPSSPLPARSLTPWWIWAPWVTRERLCLDSQAIRPGAKWASQSCSLWFG